MGGGGEKRSGALSENPLYDVFDIETPTMGCKPDTTKPESEHLHIRKLETRGSKNTPHIMYPIYHLNIVSIL